MRSVSSSGRTTGRHQHTTYEYCKKFPVTEYSYLAVSVPKIDARCLIDLELLTSVAVHSPVYSSWGASNSIIQLCNGIPNCLVDETFPVFHYFRNQTIPFSFSSVNHISCQNHLHRLGLPNTADQPLCSASSWNDAKIYFWLPKFCILGDAITISHIISSST